jgi:hypothetical protein
MTYLHNGKQYSLTLNASFEIAGRVIEISRPRSRSSDIFWRQV